MHAHVLEQLQRRRAIARVVLGRRLRRRRGPLPRQLQPDAQRRLYFAGVRELLVYGRELVDQVLVPRLPELVRGAAAERGDSVVDDVDELVGRVSRELFAAFPLNRLRDLSTAIASSTSRYQKEQLARQVRAAVGIDVPLGDPGLGARIQQFTAENVALIQSIPERYLQDVEKRILAGVRAGTLPRDIAAELVDRYEVAEASAQLIAVDQVGKFYGELNQVRQEQLGIAGFFWRTSRDSRVRETHAQLEGKKFTWDMPPDEETGEPSANGVIPGEPIRCRCFAEPDLSGILDAL